MTTGLDAEFLKNIKERLTHGEWNYIRTSLTKVEILRNQSRTRSKRYYEKISKNKKYYCEICDKHLSTKQTFQKHNKTGNHLDNVSLKNNINS